MYCIDSMKKVYTVRTVYTASEKRKKIVDKAPRNEANCEYHGTTKRN